MMKKWTILKFNFWLLLCLKTLTYCHDFLFRHVLYETPAVPPCIWVSTTLTWHCLLESQAISVTSNHAGCILSLMIFTTKPAPSQWLALLSTQLFKLEAEEASDPFLAHFLHLTITITWPIYLPNSSCLCCHSSHHLISFLEHCSNPEMDFFGSHLLFFPICSSEYRIIFFDIQIQIYGSSLNIQ